MESFPSFLRLRSGSRLSGDKGQPHNRGGHHVLNVCLIEKVIKCG
jgi:hypothetical protein